MSVIPRASSTLTGEAIEAAAGGATSRGMSYSRGIRVRGHSGTRVELVGGPHHPVIRKTATTPEYIPRLHAQRLKQERFQRLSVTGIAIPVVLAHGADWYEMEYLPMMDCIQFFERAVPTTLASRFELLLSFVAARIQSSVPAAVDCALIESKLRMIEARVPSHIWRSAYDRLSRRLIDSLDATATLPIGECHGDLTLSNVLFSEERPVVGVIDFLDSFVESPLIDLAKLRQDTAFDWTTTNYPDEHDRAKMIIVNRFLGEMLNRRFPELLRSAAFCLVEALNYFRIAPYVTTDRGHDYLRAAIARVLQNLGD